MALKIAADLLASIDDIGRLTGETAIAALKARCIDLERVDAPVTAR